MNRPALLSLLMVLATGCAHFSSRQIETVVEPRYTPRLHHGVRIHEDDGGGWTIQRETRVSVTTFFDAHNDLAKLRASTSDKTQGLTLAGLTESSSSTNTVEILRHIAAILGAVK